MKAVKRDNCHLNVKRSQIYITISTAPTTSKNSHFQLAKVNTQSVCLDCQPFVAVAAK